MYDQYQHIQLFSNTSKYLFRGTLPTSSFHQPYRGMGITPTTVDPVVASLFAARYLMDGPAVVLIARKAELADSLDGPNLLSFRHELAINLELVPMQFEARCILKVSVQDSIQLLQELGYAVPKRLHDTGALSQALLESPRMNQEDIDLYVERCHYVMKGG